MIVSTGAMADDDGFVRITLRIPSALHEGLVAAAAKKRSMNAEIIDRLEASFDEGRIQDASAAVLSREAAMNAAIVLLNTFHDLHALGDKIPMKTLQSLLDISARLFEVTKSEDPYSTLKMIRDNIVHGQDARLRS